MDPAVKNRLVVFGLAWGLVLAVVPAVSAFDDPFTLSPFLVSAFLCSALSGVAGALFAGRWVAGRTGARAALFAGVLHGAVFCALVSVLVWVCLAVNISGFSAATPGNVLGLFRDPGIFEVSGVAAAAVFAYSLSVGILLSPLSGGFIVRGSSLKGSV